MASLLITSFFTSGGTPATGLTPTLRIWEVTGTFHNLVIGTPNGSSSAVDGVMTELIDAPSMDGFYKFEFTIGLGFDPTKTYLIRTNGGVTIPIGERFQVTSNDINLLDDAATSHLIAGSIGEKISQTKADTTSLVLDMISVLALLDLLHDYESGRTKIDIVAKTLTVFEPDCVTPLRVFSLLDSTATPSTTSVCERKPIVGGTDPAPTC